MNKNKTLTNKPSFFFFIIISFLFTSSFSFAVAQDENSIVALKQMGNAFSSIAAKASPAVVAIKAEKIVDSQPYYTIPDWPFDDPFFNNNEQLRDLFRNQRPNNNRQREITKPVQGTGFIISEDGYILTNNHLVGGTKNIKVIINDNSDPIKATLIGTDPDSDIALIKIEKKNIQHLKLADSDDIQVGQWVVAIGNPFGLSHTVTAGIISAKGRNNVGINTYENFIQTDAAINPGNSGGPLLNLDGQVIGINTAIVSQSGGNMGIGFAIPINMAKGIYEQLKEGGKVVRGYLGVSLQNLTDEIAKSLGVDSSDGVIVPKVWPNSPAQKAGFKAGDIIIKLNSKKVQNANQLMNQIAVLKPGTEVNMTILRDAKTKTLTVELGDRADADNSNAKTQSQNTDNLEELLGFSVQELTNDIAKKLGYNNIKGVVVTNVQQDSQAQQKGISTGNVITEVNRQTVETLNDFKQAVEKSKDSGVILLLVRNNNASLFIPLVIDE